MDDTLSIDSGKGLLQNFYPDEKTKATSDALKRKREKMYTDKFGTDSQDTQGG
jgi:hypothetical protein